MIAGPELVSNNSARQPAYLTAGDYEQALAFAVKKLQDPYQ